MGGGGAGPPMAVGAAATLVGSGSKASAKKEGWFGPAGGTARKRQRHRVGSPPWRVWICRPCVRARVLRCGNQSARPVRIGSVKPTCLNSAQPIDDRAVRAYLRQDRGHAVSVPQKHGLERRVRKICKALLGHEPVIAAELSDQRMIGSL